MNARMMNLCNCKFHTVKKLNDFENESKQQYVNKVVFHVPENSQLQVFQIL